MRKREFNPHAKRLYGHSSKAARDRALMFRVRAIHEDGFFQVLWRWIRTCLEKVK